MDDKFYSYFCPGPTKYYYEDFQKQTDPNSAIIYSSKLYTTFCQQYCASSGYKLFTYNFQLFSNKEFVIIVAVFIIFVVFLFEASWWSENN